MSLNPALLFPFDAVCTESWHIIAWSFLALSVTTLPFPHLLSGLGNMPLAGVEVVYCLVSVTFGSQMGVHEASVTTLAVMRLLCASKPFCYEPKPISHLHGKVSSPQRKVSKFPGPQGVT